MINWSLVQERLAPLAGPVDGNPGRLTFSALMARAAERPRDPLMLSIGKEMSVVLPEYGITDTPERLAEFLAQTAHETGGYRRFEENMHYSAKRITQVWPARFPTLASAQPYAWDPSDPDAEDVALANRVYGGRMGNELDGTNDNDGWDRRGSGMLQHTGEAEYRALKERLGYECDDVRDPVKSVRAAADYWQRRRVNDFIDRNDFTGARKAVNGGTLGLGEIASDRRRLIGVLRG